MIGNYLVLETEFKSSVGEREGLIINPKARKGVLNLVWVYREIWYDKIDRITEARVQIVGDFIPQLNVLD